MKINKIINYLLLSLVLLSSCKKKSQKNDIQEIKIQEKDTINTISNEIKESLKAYYEIPHIKEFYDWQEVGHEQSALNYAKDLTTMSYGDLRLLRNEISARNGYLFNDGFLRGYFNRFKWYKPIFEVDTFKIAYNEKEKELLNKIITEESKRKLQKTMNQGNLKLFNSTLIVNNKQFTTIPKKVKEDLKNQNFSIVNANRAMPFYTYDENAYQYIPHYITTDLYLFILHKYFSRSLEKLDENYMYNQLKSILKRTLKELNKISNPSIQSTKEWSQMYNAIALYTIGDSLVTSPEKYKGVFAKEKTSIDALNGSAIFIKNDDVNYNELKPRGHYTKSEKLKKYFKTFKWISLNGINLDDNEQLKGLVLFAYTIKNNSNILKQYNDYVSVIEKLAGKEDNLSLTDILNTLTTKTIEETLADDNIATISSQLKSLNKERIKKVYGESYQTKESEIKRLYFLSSTYSISGDIFSNLIHIDAEKSKRAFPRGLDVPAVFGNTTAKNIIINEYKDNEKWPKYLPKLQILQNQFKKFNNWDHNYGFKGVQTALSASAEQDNYPDFMKTNAYNRKELNTTLASWAHIKHDLILYQEKPFAAEGGQGGGPEPPQHFSYVEPNLKFWDTALELVVWLENLSKNESTYDDELKRIKELGNLLRKTAYKEVENKEITKKEHEELHYVGGTVEYILLGLLESDHIPEREKSMALIADVYVYNGKNLNVAVGNADDIYTIVPIKGEYYIARGSVFSYYEFTGKIHNDEEWRGRIKNNDLPERPKWIKPLINNVTLLKGQMEYRYSGYGGY